MRFHRIGSIASGQFGLVTRKQALTVVTRRDLERALECGSLYRVAQGVYAFAGVPPSWERLVMTAVLAAGEDACVSHAASAVLWGLSGFDGRLRPRPEITVPNGQWPRLKGVVVHSSLKLADAHVGRLGPWRLTSVARTVCDVAPSLPRRALVSTLDQALVAGLVTVAEMTRWSGFLVVPVGGRSARCRR